MAKLTQLLHYCATRPNATVRFTANDMFLAVKSDASYLSVVKARSRAAGYPPHLSSPTAPYTFFVTSCDKVLSSAAEAELGALFHKGKEACPLRIALDKMGHPQPATRWQPTTTQPAALPLTPSSRNGQKQLTCVFIGSAIEFAKDNSKSIGAKVRPIVPIISPNIIPYLIIRPFDPRTCIRLRTPHEITSSVCPPSVEPTRVR